MILYKILFYQKSVLTQMNQYLFENMIAQHALNVVFLNLILCDTCTHLFYCFLVKIENDTDFIVENVDMLWNF